MLNKQEILDALPNFYGSENYYQYSPLLRNFLLDAVVLYCVPQDDKFVVLLPSEY